VIEKAVGKCLESVVKVELITRMHFLPKPHSVFPLFNFLSAVDSNHFKLIIVIFKKKHMHCRELFSFSVCSARPLCFLSQLTTKKSVWPLLLVLACGFIVRCCYPPGSLTTPTRRSSWQGPIFGTTLCFFGIQTRCKINWY
jgi:hypothetical protein